MKKKSKTATSLEVLKQAGMSLPDVEEGIACAGTAIEKRTLKVRKKAFLFVGLKDAMLKLSESLAEAEEFAAREPDLVKVGLNGWVTISLDETGKLSSELLQRWVEESYHSYAPKKSAETAEPKAAPGKRPKMK